MEKKENAVERFLQGYRCSQTVLEAYAERFDLPPETARKISIGLAGGSGVGGVCGAVGGAWLVIGLRYGFSHPGDPERMAGVIEKNMEFARRFKELHGALRCPELTGLEIFTEEGYAKFSENNMKEKLCANFVRDTVKILGEMMEA